MILLSCRLLTSANAHFLNLRFAVCLHRIILSRANQHIVLLYYDIDCPILLLLASLPIAYPPLCILLCSAHYPPSHPLDFTGVRFQLLKVLGRRALRNQVTERNYTGWSFTRLHSSLDLTNSLSSQFSWFYVILLWLLEVSHWFSWTSIEKLSFKVKDGNCTRGGLQPDLLT